MLASLSEDPLLSLSDAARLVGRSSRSMRRWISQGRLSAVRRGRSVWIRESDLKHALGIADGDDEAQQQISEHQAFAAAS